MKDLRSLETRPFGHTAGGDPVTLFVLGSACGVVVRIADLGGTIVGIEAPDRDGRRDQVALGLPSPEAYARAAAGENPFFGTLIGRFANRIAGGRFVLNGVEHRLPVNDPPNTLHGGADGFDKRIWRVVRQHRDETGCGLILALESPDGDAGFPGTVAVTVEYALSDDGVLRIDYRAETDRPTVINLTNHCYFNLAGHRAPIGIENHLLFIDADRFLPVDAVLIPLPGTAPVQDTPFDFRRPTAIGARLRHAHLQLMRARGYDHNWILNKREAPDALELAVRVVEPNSGRILECATTEPGLQFYSGNFLAGSPHGHDNRIYRQGDGFALETQHFPDSPNRPDFPSTVLLPGTPFRSSTAFRFGLDGG